MRRRRQRSRFEAAYASRYAFRASPFVAELLKQRGTSLIVCGLGSPTWDCFAAGDSPEYLYSWGGMGLAVPTALGLALARPERRVVAITGDGEMMMGLGSLAVIGDQAPQNLAVLVLDNERFAETGRQRGLTAGRTDLAAVARGFGIGKTMVVTEQGKAGELADFLFKAPGPVLAVAKIAVTEDPWALPEKDGAPLRVRLLAEDLIAYRDSKGDVGLVEAYCPHRRAPLFFGRNEECGIRCVYHGWKFDRHGDCTDMPSEPAGTTLSNTRRARPICSRE